nr:putative ribonuclease H-like domain-containing protein [Tanacetum cinerariifolium]
VRSYRFQSSDGYHAVPPPYTGTFMPPKPDLVFTNAPNGVEIDHSAFNVKLSPTEPDQDLSHPIRPLAPIIGNWVSDSEDESEIKPPQTVPNATPKPASPNPTSNGKRRNRKAFFVCKSLDHLIKDCDYHEKKMAQPTARNHAHMGTHKHYALMTHLNPQRHMVPVAVLTQSKPVSITAIRPVSTAIPKTSVTRPKQVQLIVTKTNSPIRRHLTCRPSPKACNLPPRVTAVKAPVVNTAQDMHGKWKWRPKCPFLDHGNPQHALKDKGVIDSGCSRHMTFDFEELNGGYVAFGGNPKGGKISRKATKDETSLILKTFFISLENQLSLKVKVIRSDNGTEFKNNDLNQFCGMKGIKREFSVSRIPQQNGIADRKNKTLNEAARTMLVDSLLPIPF